MIELWLLREEKAQCGKLCFMIEIMSIESERECILELSWRAKKVIFLLHEAIKWKIEIELL